MSYGVSITEDDTVLQTAGKYVAEDIVVGMADSIKLPAQTYNPSTVDQVIPAGKFLSGAQTFKACAGTKQITENGTYDVAGFASAAVNVPTANAATFEFSLSTNKSGASFAVVTGDLRVAAHYADDNALVSIQKIDGEKAYHWIEFLIQGNRNLTLGSSSPFYGGAGHNSTSADSFDLTNQALSSPITGTPTARAMATADGDIILYCNTARYWGTGTYKVVFSW